MHSFPSFTAPFEHGIIKQELIPDREHGRNRVEEASLDRVNFASPTEKNRPEPVTETDANHEEPEARFLPVVHRNQHHAIGDHPQETVHETMKGGALFDSAGT